MMLKMPTAVHKRFALFASILLIATFSLILSNGSNYQDPLVRAESSPSSSFDFYVLSMSYQPEFCYQHRHEKFQGCENPIDFWKESLTLHGLWPQREDGSWPSTCSNEKFDPQIVDEIIGRDKFNKYWPNVKANASSTSSIYYSFWTHEWVKHGTCSGLDQKDYFGTTLNHFLTSPDIIKENYGKSITKQDLINAYDFDVILVCSAGIFLSEVRTCVGKDENGDATVSIDCIVEVEEEGNCHDEIRLSKFYIEETGNQTNERGGIISDEQSLSGSLLSDW